MVVSTLTSRPPAQRLLALALRRCRDAEIAWEERVDLDLAALDNPRRLGGWGLRVNYEGGLGFAWGDLQEAPENLLEQAVEASREQPGQGVLFSHGLPFSPANQLLEPVDLGPVAEDLQRLVARIQFLLPSLLPNWNTRIRGGVRFQRMTLTTRSGEQTAHRTLVYLAVHADEPAPIHASFIARRVPDHPGELLCELAWRAAHSKPPKKGFEGLTGARPALFSPAATAALLRDLASDVLDARNPGELEGLSPRITLTDDGQQPEGPGSTPFDAEGQARRPVVLLGGGRVQHYLCDRLHARKLQQELQPLAVRDWGRPPRPGFSNLVLSPGDSSLPEMARELKDGILLDHLVPCDALRQPGEFCRLAQLAFKLKNGRPAERLAPMLVRARYASLLGNELSQLSRETSWHARCLTPALSCSSVQVESAEGVQESGEDPGTWW